MKKVLISGANGLLGQKLVQKLKDNPNYQVYASGKGKSRLPEDWEKGYQWIELDVTDAEQVMEVFEKVRPDFLIHTAAMTNVDDCETNKTACDLCNIEAVRYLIHACESTGTHFIHLSTDFIFSGEDGPYDEDGVPDPVNYYGMTKLKSEQLLQASQIKWAIARTVLVYGLAADMSRSNIILWVKKSLEEGKTIQVVNDQWRTPTLAEDLAEGCILIMEKGATGIFNISGKDFLTPYDMAMMTAEYFGLDKSLIKEVDSSIFKQPARRPLKTGFIIEKAQSQLGYSPKSFMDGIGILSKQIKLADL
ncbi:SDR family oxidoreductase [Cecembia calidifontis]|uniref:dTDP-4-dehydrorhamnose reductase n=1 Tax=Cecembia calidifontis TaxID=1187080 RepID=A0A4Q7P897_9BACT|nr:SDR family oxidoreductase [Cecembia calidifontis]RZS96087.1 dTDP-4-dehydrorhamnose reductase [Cecembia calidifontis]